MTKTCGAHNIKIGAGYIARQFAVFQSASPVGNFTFNPQLTDNGAGVGGNTIASFLLGYPVAGGALAFADLPALPHQRAERVRAGRLARHVWLTLNLGVRYDVFTPFTERGRSALQLRSGQRARFCSPDQNGVSTSAGVATDYSNIAPRARVLGDAAARDGGARRVRPGVLPGQLHVAVVHEERAVRRAPTGR